MQTAKNKSPSFPINLSTKKIHKVILPRTLLSANRQKAWRLMFGVVLPSIPFDHRKGLPQLAQVFSVAHLCLIFFQVFRLE
jgi:hypothetical protein